MNTRSLYYEPAGIIGVTTGNQLLESGHLIAATLYISAVDGNEPWPYLTMQILSPDTAEYPSLIVLASGIVTYYHPIGWTGRILLGAGMRFAMTGFIEYTMRVKAVIVTED